MSNLDDEVKQAQINKFISETKKAEAEKIKLDIEINELQKEVKKHWVKKEKFWKNFISILLGFSILGFYINYIVVPASQRDVIKLGLENSKKEKEIDDKLHIIREDSISLMKKAIEVDSLQIIIKAKKTQTDSIFAEYKKLYALYNKNTGNESNAIKKVTKNVKELLENYSHDFGVSNQTTTSSDATISDINSWEGKVAYATGAKLRGKNTSAFAAALKKYMDKYAVNTPLRLSAFLATVGHESGGLFYTEEIGNGNSYENRIRLGNTQLGDGIKYKGRGFIQIVGRNNYAKFGEKLHIDLINHPELLKTNVDVAVQLALEIWKEFSLNDYADKGDLSAITRKVNGGFNGLSDRIYRYNKAKQAFGLF